MDVMFSPCEDDSNVYKLISLKPFQSQQVSKRKISLRVPKNPFLTSVICQTEHAPVELLSHYHHIS